MSRNAFNDPNSLVPKLEQNGANSATQPTCIIDQSERRNFVARSNLFLNFTQQRRNIQSLISPGISILSPTSPTGTIFSQIRISPNGNLSPSIESGLQLSRRVLGPPDKETETFINTVLELEKEHSRGQRRRHEAHSLRHVREMQINDNMKAKTEPNNSENTIPNR